MDSDDFTLEQLLAEDELLQELRGLHPQLLDYFSTEAAVTKLVEYLILDPNSSSNLPEEDGATGDATAEAGAAEAETPSSDSDPNTSSNSPTQELVEAPSDEEKGEEKETDKAAEEKENEASAGQEEQKEEPQQQQQEGQAEPGKWMFQHLEESRSGEDNNNTTEKDKHPERIPDNRFIRFPYMACEIICCEMQGVINALVDGFVPLPEVKHNHHNNNKKSADSPTTTDTTTNSGSDANNNPAISSSISPGEGIEESKDDDDLSEQSQIQSSVCSSSRSSSSEEPDGEDNRQRILDLLFSVLYNTEAGQLDDFRAGYLEKILSVLFRVRPEAMSEYINTGGGRGNVSLMKAMFRHLYSHSMMQLVQRLLLPTPQHLQQQNDDNSDNEDDNSDDEDDEDNLILGAQMGGMMGDDQDDESKTLRCNWSDSGEALDLLLQPLIYPNASPSAPTAEVDSEVGAELSDEEKDLKLNLSQNSSEVLITIIQNSPLNSETMLRLTVDPVMERLVEGSSCLKDGEEFSHHESNLTATMNVLESLILQLGGYGSVGTISLMPDENGEGEDGQSTGEQPPPPQFADLKSLLSHIPRLLESLSILLRHPSCEKWRSPMQFSEPTDPQLLLGMSRLRIVRLLESLVLLGESNVDSLLCQSDCLEICLDLFWKFQWCSMLHQSVANLLVHVFEGANARSEMQEYFLVKCNLLGRLMSSFVEVAHPGEPSFGPHDHAIADFSAQEVVFAMKNLKLENENAPVNAPQPNDLGDRTDVEVGRVPTDDIIPVSDDDVDAVLEQQEAGGAGALADLTPEEPAKEQSAQEESVLSVGQISTEAVRFESLDASVVSATLDAPAQSFRLGYMGHVIIICQALVHACSTENEEPENTAPDSTMGEEDDPQMSLLAESQQEEADLNGERSSSSDSSSSSSDSPPPPPPPSDGESPADEVPMGRDDGESARAVDSDAEGIPPPSLLMLSKLIDSHPLQTRWHEFVRTTLATETTIQSTPLGGYNNSPLPGGDPLHAHRPLGDDDDFDDGSGQPNMPPRGMLGGGDVLDLDDNDLDIAASMMAGLHMGRGGNDGDDDDDDDDDSDEDDVGSSGSGNTYDENAAKGGYFFDDPLGNKKQSGLGLALGNLKTYHAGSSDEEDDDDDEDDSDKASSSDQSSEEEADNGNSPLRRTGSDGDDVPVMNLFAGNIPGEAGEPTATFDDNTWSNFANFDDAFAGASASSAAAGAGFVADFEHADMGSADKEKPDMDADFPDNFADNFEAPKTVDDEDAHRLDDIFGKPTSHAILLEEDEDDTPSDSKASSDPFAVSDGGDNDDDDGPEQSSETPEATEGEETPEVTDVELGHE